MLCTRFDLILPSGSREGIKNVKSLQTGLVEISPVVLEKSKNITEEKMDNPIDKG